jgi:hypothetical protein
MPDSYRPSDQDFRRYREITSTIGREFADRASHLLSTRIPPDAELVLLGLSSNGQDRFPNDYPTFLEAALQGANYKPSVIRGAPMVNGSILPKEISENLVQGKTAIVVEVHYSPFALLYVAELRAKGASQQFYTAPTPPPAGVWELSNDDELVPLKNSV